MLVKVYANDKNLNVNDISKVFWCKSSVTTYALVPTVHWRVLRICNISIVVTVLYVYILKSVRG